MSTIKEVFRDAIAHSNWDDICRVYEAITGELAPSPPMEPSPGTLADILNQSLEEADEQLDPYPEEDDVRGIPTPHDDTTPPEPDGTISVPPIQSNADNQVTSDIISKCHKAVDDLLDDVTYTPPEDTDTATPQPNSDTETNEFHIEHGNTAPTTNEEGEQQCRKEAMVIPEERTNRFRDNGKAYADEKVTNDPNNPKLGIQIIRPRGNRDDELLGADTGGTIEATCSLCGETAKIATNLSHGFHKNPEHNTYKCNACNTPNGRNKALRKQRQDNQGPRRAHKG